MMRLFLLLTIILLLVVFVVELKKYLLRENKTEEFQEVKLEGDVINLEKKIAKEKIRQNKILSEIDEINSKIKLKEEDDYE